MTTPLTAPLRTLAAALLLAGCAPDAADTLGPAAAASPAAVRVAAAGAGRTTHRPISDFVERQGVYCALPENAGGPFCPNLFPGLDVISWFDPDPERNLCAAVDYPGIADRYLRAASGGAVSLGTSFDGTVRERELNDGRAEVTVNLRTDNALAFVQSCTGAPFSPSLMGAFPSEVLAGAVPLLATAHLSLTFIAPAPGLPLPAIIQVYAAEPETYELVKFSFHAQAVGALTAASGYPEVTRARLVIQQVGRPTPGILRNGGDYPGDYWPVEFVKLHVLGH